MPISNRTPPKVISQNLAVTENQLRKGTDGIKTAEGSYGFNDDDKAVLQKAKDVLLNARIQNEFPIVARVLGDVVKRVEGGEKLEWTPEQTKGFLDLVGELSYAENDTLNKLRDLGVIPAEQWDSFVTPHKDQTNLLQSGFARKAKWGLASMGGMLPTLVLGYGAAIAIGGPLGALAALGASTTFGMTVGKKVQEKIGTAAFLENSKLGVNADKGEEVTSEAMLLTSRAAQGDVLLDTEGSLLDRLKREAALGDMVVQARASSGTPIGPLEQPFIDIAAKYLEGLGPIADKLDKGQLTETEARKAVFDLRAHALDAGKLDGVAKIALSTYVNYPDGQKLVFLRQLATSSEQLVEHLKQNGGKASETERGEAAAMIQIYHATQGELGTLSMDALSMLATVANNIPLKPEQIQILEDQVAGPAAKLSAELEPKLVATPDVAVKQAKLAFDVLWGTVVPSFNEIKDAPVAKGIKTTPLEGGGFEVSGRFKGGILSFLGIGSEGNFSVKVDDAGHVDADSMKIDLGPKFAKYVGGKAFETYKDMIGLKVGTSGVDVDDNKTADGRYTVRGRVGDMNGNVEVSPMGMVAWDTMKVT